MHAINRANGCATFMDLAMRAALVIKAFLGEGRNGLRDEKNGLRIGLRGKRTLERDWEAAGRRPKPFQYCWKRRQGERDSAQRSLAGSVDSEERDSTLERM